MINGRSRGCLYWLICLVLIAAGIWWYYTFTSRELQIEGMQPRKDLQLDSLTQVPPGNPWAPNS